MTVFERLHLQAARDPARSEMWRTAADLRREDLAFRDHNAGWRAEVRDGVLRVETAAGGLQFIHVCSPDSQPSVLSQTVALLHAGNQTVECLSLTSGRVLAKFTEVRAASVNKLTDAVALHRGNSVYLCCGKEESILCPRVVGLPDELRNHVPGYGYRGVLRLAAHSPHRIIAGSYLYDGNNWRLLSGWPEQEVSMLVYWRSGKLRRTVAWTQPDEVVYLGSDGDLQIYSIANPCNVVPGLCLTAKEVDAVVKETTETSAA